MQSSDTSFAARFLSAFDESIDLPIKNYYGGFLRRHLSRIIPLSVVAKIDPTAAVLHEIFVFAESCARAYSAQAAVAGGAAQHSKPHPIVFDALQGLPEWRTRYESMDMIVAGSDTTAWTLTMVLFQVLRREDVKRRIEEAARRALPDLDRIPSYVELEKDEYLVFGFFFFLLLGVFRVGLRQTMLMNESSLPASKRPSAWAPPSRASFPELYPVVLPFK